MRLIKQYHEIINEPDPYKLIELCGRVCYKSEDKITDTSCFKFIKMLKSVGHLSVLEHVYIAFTCPTKTIEEIRNLQINPELDMNLLEQPTINDKYITCSTFQNNIASGNLRAWMEFLSLPNIPYNSGIKAIEYELSNIFPHLFNSTFWDGKKVLPIHPTNMSLMERAIHSTKTIRFITNRGVTHELVRHRPCAFSQESTRYIKYEGEINFILPAWMDEQYLGTYTSLFRSGNSNDPSRIFIESCILTELNYKSLLILKWQAQEAREVLSNAVKTEIIITGTLREWYHIFKLRCSKKAHPQMRALMLPVFEELLSLEPEIFNGLTKLIGTSNE